MAQRFQHKTNPVVLEGADTHESILSIFEMVLLSTVHHVGLLFFVHCSALNWVQAGSMSSPRFKHTQTLLADGTVLLCGGTDEVAGRTCDLFEPKLFLWGTTSDMSVSRASHSATLLWSGKVLVCGGITGMTRHSSCELYDPADRSFLFTGNMSVPRVDMSAMRRNDGKVLLCGGDASSSSDCDLFDATVGVFQSVNFSSAMRVMGKLFTLLDKGSVLVCGDSSCELCDSLSFSCKFAGNLTVGSLRGSARATRLNGGSVLICGALSDANRCDVYNAVSGSFSSVGPLSVPRFDHSAVLLSNSLGLVLLCGGRTSSTTQVGVASCEMFDPETQMFVVCESLAVTRSFFTFEALNSTAALACGGTNGQSLATCELWSSCGSVTVSAPSFMCLNSATQLAGSSNFPSGMGNWSVLSSSLGSGDFSNVSDPNAKFLPTRVGRVFFRWSLFCNDISSTMITAAPTAKFSSSVEIGCGISLRLGVKLSGDASDGLWSGFLPGSVDNEKSAFVTFTWSSSQVGTRVNLSFTPNSVCSTPAFVLIDILASCPTELSTEAIIGISIGVFLAVTIAIIASLFLYRFLNRKRVQFRNDVEFGER